MELIQYSLDTWKFKTQEDFLKAMNEELQNVKQSFFKLGMYLSEAYVKRYNNGTGIDDFFEWCDLSFGLQKSTVYNFMRIYNVFRDKRRTDIGIIDERYSDFGQSQLTELLPASKYLDRLPFVKPSDSVATIRKVVKIGKKMRNTPHVECSSSEEYINRFGNILLDNKNQTTNSYYPKKLKGVEARNACYFILQENFKLKEHLASEIANYLVYEVLRL